jgi:ABC-2 type transport system ATP-binding protein
VKLVEVRKLCKTYRNGVRANQDISLEVKAGELVGILGPNGAGKTTLVKQIVGLLRPTSGEVFIRGRPVTRTGKIVQESVSYLAQNPVAFIDLTAFECIHLTGQFRGLSPGESRRQTLSLMDTFRLAECAKRLFFHLSGGQRHLVNLCSALIGDREILILDEPTTFVDPILRRVVWQKVRERAQHQGSAVLLVTHNVLEAEQVLDRVILMNRGRVAAIGGQAELKRKFTEMLSVEVAFTGEAPELDLLTQRIAAEPGKIRVEVNRSQVGEVIAILTQSIGSDSIQEIHVVGASLEDVYARVLEGGAANE